MVQSIPVAPDPGRRPGHRPGLRALRARAPPLRRTGVPHGRDPGDARPLHRGLAGGRHRRRPRPVPADDAGRDRQRSRASGHALALVANRHSSPPARLRFSREGPVLEREPIPAPAALDGVARPDALRQGDDALAIGTAHPVGDRGDPALPLGPHPEGEACSAWAVDHLPGTCAGRHGDVPATVRASHGAGHHRLKRRRSLPRSNPTITSSPTMMTGTASRPVLAVSSARAASSSATFFALNAMPRDERNSFAA